MSEAELSEVSDEQANNVFAVSGKIGQMVQQSTDNPVDGLSVLMATLGRFMAREALGGSITGDQAWALVCTEAFRELFLFGFENEREILNQTPTEPTVETE